MWMASQSIQQLALSTFCPLICHFEQKRGCVQVPILNLPHSIRLHSHYKEKEKPIPTFILFKNK
jgi:hypothetical protein